MFRSVVEAVFYHAENTPDKLCIADETRSVTYSQYKEEIRKMASQLVSLGVKKSDRVLVEASQTVSYLGLELAIQLIGAVFVPVERNCAWNKIARLITVSGAKIAVTMKPAPEEADVKVFTLSEMVEAAASKEMYAFEVFPKSDDVSEILFSTGTTGAEKGIIISHDNNIALAENVMYGVKMLEDNVEMIPSPLNHSHGLRRYYGNMVKGATVVLITGAMNVLKFFQMMDQYNVNSLDLVPTALSVLLKLSKNKFEEYKDVIRYIQFGSAPLIMEDMEKIKAMLPNTRLYNFYGSTESGCICIYDFNTDNDKAKCIGKPAHNAKIVIVDDNRNEIQSSADNTGLVASYGRMNMLGYWNDEEETKKAMADGFIYSNDEAYFDEDGDIILLGRKGDVINTGGNKVSPEEIEGAALKHESVADCGCIGVADSLKGSVPKLFVQVKDGCNFDSIALRTHLASLLEPYKVPEYIVQIDKIPRSFNGKILRRVLKEIND